MFILSSKAKEETSTHRQTPTKRRQILRTISLDTAMSLSTLFSFADSNYTKEQQLILLSRIDVLKMLHRASFNI